MSDNSEIDRGEYKFGVVIALASEGMAEPYVSLEIIGIEHQSANAILTSRRYVISDDFFVDEMK